MQVEIVGMFWLKVLVKERVDEGRAERLSTRIQGSEDILLLRAALVRIRIDYSDTTLHGCPPSLRISGKLG
jgi:hypothetical protein